MPSFTDMKQCRNLVDQIIQCKRCPRLVSFRETVSISSRRFPEQEYWRKPVPGFGDIHGRLMILGLAPAATGGNRTGRVFTGDKSAEFLVSALYEEGFASQSFSVSRNDGLRYIDSYVTAAVKCVPPDNRPSKEEQINCLGFLGVELKCMTNVKAILVLGAFALSSLNMHFKHMYRGFRGIKFRNGGYEDVGGIRVFMSYHPSPRNVNTGKLTRNDFLKTLRNIRAYFNDSGGKQ